MRQQVRLIVDLDEVFADFVGGVLRDWGVAYHTALDHWEPGYWSVVPALSRALGRPGTGRNGEYVGPLTDGEMWDRGVLDRAGAAPLVRRTARHGPVRDRRLARGVGPVALPDVPQR
jgi:hypothetical protein